MIEVPVETRAHTQFVPLNTLLQQIVREHGPENGVLHVHIPHTTAGITINLATGALVGTYHAEERHPISRSIFRVWYSIRAEGSASLALREGQASALGFYLDQHRIHVGDATTMADDLFGVVRSGQVQIHIDQRFALEDVQQAHRALEARQTTGCSVLQL